jgi:hypothetical protein
MKRRKGFDDQGRPVSEVESPTGSFRLDLDTARLRELKVEELSLEESTPAPRTHFSPYDNGAGRVPPPPTKPARPRRSGLDELRALSEEIKRRREAKDPAA